MGLWGCLADGIKKMCGWVCEVVVGDVLIETE